MWPSSVHIRHKGSFASLAARNACHRADLYSLRYSAASVDRRSILHLKPQYRWRDQHAVKRTPHRSHSNKRGAAGTYALGGRLIVVAAATRGLRTAVRTASARRQPQDLVPPSIKLDCLVSNILLQSHTQFHTMARCFLTPLSLVTTKRPKRWPVRSRAVLYMAGTLSHPAKPDPLCNSSATMLDAALDGLACVDVEHEVRTIRREGP